MANKDDTRDRVVTYTAEEARAWAESPEGKAELARIAAMEDQDIDFSDIPELACDEPRASPVERLLDEVGSDPAALADVLDAVSRRLRAVTSKKAG